MTILCYLPDLSGRMVPLENLRFALTKEIAIAIAISVKVLQHVPFSFIVRNSWSSTKLLQLISVLQASSLVPSTHDWSTQTGESPISYHFLFSFPPYIPFPHVQICSQLQRAAKILDSGAVRATRFLWRYPTARVILLCYLVRTVIYAFLNEI